ncbi:4-aminobutyrate aminotransferase-like enzyme [Geodermatophilus bullaregiensis]|uniref:aspartate aminotransferase family protein n=1 Tax=Geodermatophilus bullaregiensis TaxID=1564160 RepID=UPI00195A1E40|nr:aspartate aminotransferase family protein [Geodermatophilus bullaregiensis]MBM7805059.1 4-aminobutyrate aminotransferase-like enzyme [Geodermatophilus bullaregiensis]
MTSQRMHMANSYDPAAARSPLPPSAAALLERRERVLGAPYRLFYDEPLEAVRGEGVLLFDAAGRDHLDVYNNVPAVGHSNPRVQRAVADQLGRLNTHTRYLTHEVVDYAERLTALFPPHLQQVVFCCSGSEAVDLAMRIAEYGTGAAGWLVTRHAYHGTTRAAAAVSPSLGPNNPISGDVVLVDAPDQLREDPAEVEQAFAARVAEGVETLRQRGVALAGLLVDSCLSSDGLQLDPAGWLRAAVDVVHRHGGVYVADEVQPGFGRLGTGWWGFPRHDVAPDLVVLGKPMGNGLPISAVVGRPALFDRFGRDVRYFNTFGGNPVCTAAAAAVLDEIEDRALVPHAAEVGRHLLDELRRLTADDERVGEVRGAGLFAAVELVRDRAGRTPDAGAAAFLVNELRRRRVLISASGRDGNVLKVRPPLVFGHRDAERFLTEFDGALSTLGASR